MAITLYKITNLINNKLYIGQTKCSIKTRWSRHRNKGSHCKLLYNAIIKYGDINFKIEEIIIVNTREEANKLEKELIINNNSLYPNGYNLTNGGSAFDHNENTKRKIGKSHKGMKRSLQARQNMSNAAKGKIISEKQKNSISSTLISKINVKKVKCLDNNIVYRSAKEAAKQLNLRASGISLVLNGYQKTTGGYRFIYE